MYFLLSQTAVLRFSLPEDLLEGEATEMHFVVSIAFCFLTSRHSPCPRHPQIQISVWVLFSEMKMTQVAYLKDRQEKF